MNENRTIISLDEKKRIMLSIMDEIDYFCRNHDIEYFLVGGTLLGAVRHKGFIPWDDDMDIGLTRENYVRLLKEFESSSGNVSICDVSSSRSYKWANAKAFDNRTELIEVGDKKHTTGVFIDIFPFDGINGNRKNAEKEVRKKKIWKDILTLKHLKISARRSAFNNFVVIMGRVLVFLPDRFIIRNINKCEASPISPKDCDYVCNFTGAWGMRELSDSKNFISYIDAEFEGRLYRIPVGYDDYLKTIYGDYMTPPPPDKQITHHDSIAYWKETLK